MHRLTFLLISGLIAMPTLAAMGTANAGTGQWSSIVAILDGSNNHYLLKTSSGPDASTCMTELQQIASRVGETGGYVWTTPDKKNMRYEKEESPPNYEYKRAKVLELRCVREPFEGELVRR